MGIISSAMLHSWEEMGCIDNDNSEELEQLKAENDKLKTCLQEIKGIVTALSMNNWLQMNETARKSIQLLQKKITKAESEG